MKLKSKNLKPIYAKVKRDNIDKSYDLIYNCVSLNILDDVSDNVAGLVSLLIMARIRAQIHDNLINQFRSLK